MDFTRQPVLETIITPREGFKLVVRSSKGNSQEEYFVEALEIVTFGHAAFFRSLEKPKCFLLPISDYEVLEVRETRIALKQPSALKPIKIGLAKETPKVVKPVEREEEPSEAKQDKKRERRRKTRRRARSDLLMEEAELSSHEAPEEPMDLPVPGFKTPEVEAQTKEKVSKLFPAPATLIRDTIARYRESDSFKDAFYPEGEKHPESAPEGDALMHHPVTEPTFATEPGSSEEHESLWDFGHESEAQPEAQPEAQKDQE